jgi:hypothetical protein
MPVSMVVRLRTWPRLLGIRRGPSIHQLVIRVVSRNRSRRRISILTIRHLLRRVQIVRLRYEIVDLDDLLGRTGRSDTRKLLLCSALLVSSLLVVVLELLL